MYLPGLLPTIAERCPSVQSSIFKLDRWTIIIFAIDMYLHTDLHFTKYCPDLLSKLPVIGLKLLENVET